MLIFEVSIPSKFSSSSISHHVYLLLKSSFSIDFISHHFSLFYSSKPKNTLLIQNLFSLYHFISSFLYSYLPALSSFFISHPLTSQKHPTLFIKSIINFGYIYKKYKSNKYKRSEGKWFFAKFFEIKNPQIQTCFPGANGPNLQSKLSIQHFFAFL